MCYLTCPQPLNVVVRFRVVEEAGKRKLRDGSGGVEWTVPSRLSKNVWTRQKKRRNAVPFRKQRFNFYVVKDGENRSFTVFPVSGNVICTGVKMAKYVPEALASFCRLTSVGEDGLSEWEVVNSTYLGKILCINEGVPACRMMALYKKLEAGRDVSIAFRSQFFPGVRIRWTGLGTINLFNNGKYVLVGVKTDASAKILYEKLCAITRKYWTTLDEVTWCAWGAASSSTG